MYSFVVRVLNHCTTYGRGETCVFALGCWVYVMIGGRHSGLPRRQVITSLATLFNKILDQHQFAAYSFCGVNRLFIVITETDRARLDAGIGKGSAESFSFAVR